MSHVLSIDYYRRFYCSNILDIIASLSRIITRCARPARHVLRRMVVRTDALSASNASRLTVIDRVADCSSANHPREQTVRCTGSICLIFGSIGYRLCANASCHRAVGDFTISANARRVGRNFTTNKTSAYN